MKKFTALLLLLVTFCGVSAQTASFEASPAPTQVDGVWQFAEDTKWYSIYNLGSKAYFCTNQKDADGYITLEDTKEPTSDYDRWCFVGDNENGYRLYNKAEGPTKVLGVNNNTSSDGKLSRTQMIDYPYGETSSTANGQVGYLFVLQESSFTGYGMFCLKGTETAIYPYYLASQTTGTSNVPYLSYKIDDPRFAGRSEACALQFTEMSLYSLTLKKVEQALAAAFPNLGFIYGVDENAYIELRETKEACEAMSDKETATTLLENALEEFTQNSELKLKGGEKVIIGNRQFKDLFMRAKETNKSGESGVFLGAGPHVSNYRYLFTMVKADDTEKNFYIYSDYFGKYVSIMPTTDGTEFTLSDTPYSYMVANSDSFGYVQFRDLENTTKTLCMADWRSEHPANGIVRGGYDNHASQFRLYVNIDIVYKRFNSLLEAEAAKLGEGIGYYRSGAGVEDALTAFRNADLNTKGVRARELEEALQAAANLPEEGKYYSIGNATATDQIVGENYDANVSGQNRVRSAAPGTNIVPSLWQFEKVKDSDFDHFSPLYHIKAANSSNYISKVYGDYASARMVPAGNANIGLYDLFNTEVTRDGKAASLVHYTDSTRKEYGTLTTDTDGHLINTSSTSTNNRWIIQEVNEIPVTITSVGYATLHLPFAVTVPDEVIAYAGIDKETKVTLRDIGKALPALTPVVIKSEGRGEFIFPINYDSTEDGTTFENDLLGTLTPYMPEDKSIPYYIFKQAANGNVGFYRVTTFNNPMGANKAYLSSPAGETASAVKLFGFDEITGMDSAVTNEEADETYYDLQGRRVLYPTNGVFIKGNGQKVLIR